MMKMMSDVMEVHSEYGYEENEIELTMNCPDCGCVLVFLRDDRRGINMYCEECDKTWYIVVDQN